jgi:thymidylate synthase
MKTIVIKANNERGLKEMPIIVANIMIFATGEFNIAIRTGVPEETDATHIVIDSDLYYNQLEQLDYIQNQVAYGTISIEEQDVSPAEYYALGYSIV